MKARSKLKRYGDLRNLRKRQEDMQSQKYASAVRSIRSAEQERETLEARRLAMIMEAGVPAGTLIDVEQQRALHQYERHLARRIIEQDALIREREETALQIHGMMLEAVKLRKMMETLQNHARDSIKNDFNRQARVDTDEVVSIRAALNVLNRK